jgi:CCR4-NOT transcription complex subunit 1
MLDEQTRHSQSFQSLDIKARLVLPANEGVPHGTKYNVPLLNALVLYIGMQVGTPDLSSFDISMTF